MPNTILLLAKQIYLDADEDKLRGLCKGFAEMAANAMLARDKKQKEDTYSVFRKRLGDLDHYVEEKGSFSTAYRIQDPGKFPVESEDERQFLLSVRGLYDGMISYQEPDRLHEASLEYLQQHDDQKVTSYVQSPLLEKKERIEVGSFIGLYNPSELQELMTLFIDSLSEPPEDFVLMLGSGNHAISLGLDAEKKEWFLADINQPKLAKESPRKYTAEEVQKFIFDAFKSKEDTLFQARILSTNDRKTGVAKMYSDLQLNDRFKALHQVDAKKIQHYLAHLSTRYNDNKLLKEILQVKPAMDLLYAKDDLHKFDVADHAVTRGNIDGLRMLFDYEAESQNTQGKLDDFKKSWTGTELPRLGAISIYAYNTKEVLDFLMKWPSREKVTDNRSILCSALSNAVENIKIPAIFEEKFKIINTLGETEKMNILNVKNSIGHTLLYDAVQKGNLAALSVFIQQGVDLSKENLVSIAIKEQRNEVLDMLLKHRANIDLPDKYGNAAIHVASQYDNFTYLLNKLIEAHAALDQANNEGLTAAHFTARIRCANSLRALADNKANLDVSDKTGLKPCHYAADRGNIESLYIIARAGIDLSKQVPPLAPMLAPLLREDASYSEQIIQDIASPLNKVIQKRYDLVEKIQLPFINGYLAGDEKRKYLQNKTYLDTLDKIAENVNNELQELRNSKVNHRDVLINTAELNAQAVKNMYQDFLNQLFFDEPLVDRAEQLKEIIRENKKNEQLSIANQPKVDDVVVSSTMPLSEYKNKIIETGDVKVARDLLKQWLNKAELTLKEPVGSPFAFIPQLNKEAERRQKNLKVIQLLKNNSISSSEKKSDTEFLSYMYTRLKEELNKQSPPVLTSDIRKQSEEICRHLEKLCPEAKIAYERKKPSGSSSTLSS